MLFLGFLHTCLSFIHCNNLNYPNSNCRELTFLKSIFGYIFKNPSITYGNLPIVFSSNAFAVTLFVIKRKQLSYSKQTIISLLKWAIHGTGNREGETPNYSQDVYLTANLPPPLQLKFFVVLRLDYIKSPPILGVGFRSGYRSGTVNSKSFVGKVLLRIKWKFELNYTL